MDESDILQPSPSTYPPKQNNKAFTLKMQIHAQLPLIPMTHGLVLHYFHRLTPHEVITLWRKNVCVCARVR